MPIQNLFRALLQCELYHCSVFFVVVYLTLWSNATIAILKIHAEGDEQEILPENVIFVIHNEERNREKDNRLIPRFLFHYTASVILWQSVMHLIDSNRWILN